MSKLEHVAFICDGNGRWAKKQGKERTYGHNVGSDVVKDVAIHLKKHHRVKSVSFYIFSTENWKRPKHEILVILRLLDSKMKKWINLFLEENVRLKFIGSRNGLDKGLIKFMDKYEKMTEHCDEMTLNLCFNYGSRNEIVEGIQALISDGVKACDVSEEVFSNYLYTKDQPEVDLLIRTSGEYRISNYYLWQLAYSELSFIDCFWPEVTSSIIDNVIDNYYRRNRRFGGLDES